MQIGVESKKCRTKFEEGVIKYASLVFSVCETSNGNLVAQMTMFIS